MNILGYRFHFTELFSNVWQAADRSVRIFTTRIKSNWRTPTYSWGRPDYSYWRRAYYCQVVGLELAGLFIKPIVNKIAAWVLGRQPSFRCRNAASQRALEEWWDLHHSEILRGFRSALKQGDSFLAINSDLSVTILPPDIVDPIVDPDDYSKRIGWKVRQIFPHPDNSGNKMVVVDEYYEDRRIHTVEFPDGRRSVEVFRNLIGIVPLVHIANQPSDGEEFGHPEAEALVDLFHRYGQVFEAAIEGNILQGRPTPVISFNTVQDLNAFWRRYGREDSKTLADGTVQKIATLSLDMSEVLTISNADMNYRSPGTFAEDTEKLLGLLFYLMLEHAELPEFVLGNAIEGSKASAETQMPVFEGFIRMRQRDCLRWILNIAAIVLGYLALIKPGVTVEDVTLRWAKLTQNGRLTMESVQWAYGEGLMGDRVALLSLPMDLENVDEILKEAKKDLKKRQKLGLQSGTKILSGLPVKAAVSSNGNGKVAEMDPSLQKDIEDLDI